MTEKQASDTESSAKNSSLRTARKEKNGEFYTQWVDIEREINAYLEYDKDLFRDKVVLLPCDDPEWSNFTKFFALHFMDLGLKKLVSTSYAPESNMKGAFKESDLLVYVCTGTEPEIKEWFKTINIAGVPLNLQELRNSIYSGPFVTAAKAEFSNSGNSNQQKWSHFVKGDPKRQEVLEAALGWVSASKGQEIEGYMAAHRQDTDIDELKTYFTTVIDWVTGVFPGTPDKSMCGLDWGGLYEAYHGNSYQPAKVQARVDELLEDPAINNHKGIYEYLLGGEKDTQLLDVRFFDATTKKAAYADQTKDAKAKSVSNCSVCASGNNANKTRIYKLNEMEADHVTAWSKGGASTLANCEMLCKSHNRAKGNR